MNIATQMNQKKTNEKAGEPPMHQSQVHLSIGRKTSCLEERPSWESTTNVERCCVPHYKTV